LAKHRIPSFLAKLDAKEKERMMKEWMALSNHDSVAYLKKHFLDKLDKLAKEDEGASFSSWFQTKWQWAKNYGKRQAYREIIKEMTISGE
jgi:hypothetical protein